MSGPSGYFPLKPNRRSLGLEPDSGPSVLEQRADSYSDSLAQRIAADHNISVEEARKIVDAN